MKTISPEELEHIHNYPEDHIMLGLYVKKGVEKFLNEKIPDLQWDFQFRNNPITDDVGINEIAIAITSQNLPKNASDDIDQEILDLLSDENFSGLCKKEVFECKFLFTSGNVYIHYYGGQIATLNAPVYFEGFLRCTGSPQIIPRIIERKVSMLLVELFKYKVKPNSYIDL